MKNWDFEKPILELEQKIQELKHFSEDKHVDLSAEIKELNKKLKELYKKTYSQLTPWQKVQIARHPQRPTTLDYIELIMTEFLPLHGDRLFRDDKALITGFAKLEGKKVAVIGHQKGKDVNENVQRNFGCAHPEGYRKAMRIMTLADRFSIPIICFIDTPGAYPGIGAEERGQAQAIAENIRDMFALKVPIIVVIIGEGGSGGALGIGIGDKVMIMEYAYYSVISPEGCAAILWKDAARKEDAAKVLKLTAPELLNNGLVDKIISEPQGGAHKDPAKTAEFLKKELIEQIEEISKIPPEDRISLRYKKYRKVGVFAE
ncbi:MAG: acetyl-CoA carboxylase carboxyltransferase subunit alpha [Candidatus Omnitrophica bacterium]|nr:acetyl-CoA carboxylase carboxyltransferase subunit alpha [Candidatus Omnitrophota bacterium]MDD5080862.1 acetyl-CoA carboxylase carboxyltransferase subunit alpha [Candidatus Omnitrophota bacterium]